MNEITTFHNNAMSVDDLNRSMAESRSAAPAAEHGGDTMLKMKWDSGVWHYGQENIEVEPDSLWVINPYNLQSGWVWWADPKIAGGPKKMDEVMGLFRNPPHKPSHRYDEMGGDWKEQIGIPMVCLTGEDTGLEVLYRNNSNGAKKAYEQLFNDVQGRPDNYYEYPIVELLHRSYKHNAFKRTIFEPVFKVVDWSNKDREFLSKSKYAPAIEAPEVDPVATEPTPEPQAEAPRRRRRRSVK